MGFMSRLQLTLPPSQSQRIKGKDKQNSHGKPEQRQSERPRLKEGQKQGEQSMESQNRGQGEHGRERQNRGQRERRGARQNRGAEIPGLQPEAEREHKCLERGEPTSTPSSLGVTVVLPGVLMQSESMHGFSFTSLPSPDVPEFKLKMAALLSSPFFPDCW